MRRILIGVAGVYLGIGAALSTFLGYACPAVSVAGHIYYALAWPAFVAAGGFHAPQPPIPAWCFNFK